MKYRNDLTAEFVRKIIIYEKTTGLITWLPRTADMFEDGGHTAEHICKRWNGEHAGKTVNTITRFGYIALRINGVRYLAHRVAWLYATGEWPINQIDHRNGVRTDNRWDNFREATQLQNSQNLKTKRSNKSGFQGVHWSDHHKKWLASIKVARKNIHLGTFDSAEEAHAALSQSQE
jgi:hypothetical protein